MLCVGNREITNKAGHKIHVKLEIEISKILHLVARIENILVEVKLCFIFMLLLIPIYSSDKVNFDSDEIVF